MTLRRLPYRAQLGHATQQSPKRVERSALGSTAEAVQRPQPPTISAFLPAQSFAPLQGCKTQQYKTNLPSLTPCRYQPVRDSLKIIEPTGRNWTSGIILSTSGYMPKY